jgi:uncharacterized protein YbcI
MDTPLTAIHPPTDTAPPLTGTALLAAISTDIVAILRDRYGRGPLTAKAYALDDLLIVVTRDDGFTALEQTIMDHDEASLVVTMRRDFEHDMSKLYQGTIERLTGRTVLAFLSQSHVEPGITMETFFLDGPLDGFGVVDIVRPRRPRRPPPA